MTKFALFLTVCSFLTQDCEMPIKHTQLYNTWYDCVASAHLNGLKMLQNYDPDIINKYHLGVQFQCAAEFEM